VKAKEERAEGNDEEKSDKFGFLKFEVFFATGIITTEKKVLGKIAAEIE